MKIGVHKVAMASPSDVSELARKIDEKEIDPAEIVALIGKTEGNGGANDFTRGFATLSYQLLLADRLKTSPEEIAKKDSVCLVRRNRRRSFSARHHLYAIRIREPASRFQTCARHRDDAEHPSRRSWHYDPGTRSGRRRQTLPGSSRHFRSQRCPLRPG